MVDYKETIEYLKMPKPTKSAYTRLLNSFNRARKSDIPESMYFVKKSARKALHKYNYPLFVSLAKKILSYKEPVQYKELVQHKHGLSRFE